MQNRIHTARLVAVDNDNEGREQSPRAKAFMERLTRLGMHKMSRREGEKVLGISGDAWMALRNGKPGYDTTIDKAELGLAAWLEETGTEEPEPGPVAPAAEIEFKVTIAALGVDVTAKGRPEDADTIREQVRRLVSDLMTRGD